MQASHREVEALLDQVAAGELACERRPGASQRPHHRPLLLRRRGAQHERLRRRQHGFMPFKRQVQLSGPEHSCTTAALPKPLQRSLCIQTGGEAGTGRVETATYV